MANRSQWVLVAERKAVVAAIAIALVGGCEKNAPTSPSAARDGRTTKNASDSAGAGITTMDVTPPSDVTSISVKAGDRLTVTVSSNECSGNPESVNVYGVISGTIISGSCAGGLVGQTVTLPPVGVDGTVSFTATHQEYGEGAAAPVTGSFPDYSVFTDDGCCSGSPRDYNDVILSVRITRDSGVLTCVPLNPTRYQNVSCTVTGTGVVVTSWTFTGPSYDGTIIWRVTGPTSKNSWKGPVVTSGDVTAEATVNGKPRSSPLTAKLSVQRRTGNAWNWGPGNHWQYTTVAPGSSPCVLQGAMLYNEVTAVGQSFRKNNCDSDVLTPNPRVDASNGYSVRQVPDGGINEGIWYVAGISYQMLTWSMVNPAITSGSSLSHTLTNQADIDRCKAGTGKIITKANFYFFNKSCAKSLVDALISATLNHEGRGCCSGNGHQAQLEIAANEVAFLLYAIDEGMLAIDQATLSDMVSSDAKRINSELNLRWASHANVKGNYSSQLWMWHPDWKQFFTAIIHD